MKCIKYFMKMMISGILAFGILNLLCFVYHNKPLSVNVDDGATATKYESNRTFSIMHEGWGRGRINDDGYNNMKDIQDIAKIDVLLMGSSQMEGFQVAQEQTVTAVMNRLSDGELFTYNVGVSGHDFYYCVHDLENALTTYRPKQFAVLELSNIKIGSVSLEQIFDLPVGKANSSGVVGFLKSIPYIRLLAIQYDDLHHKAEFGGESVVAVSSEEGLIDCGNTRDILSYIVDICEAHKVTPIIFLRQDVCVDEEGRGYTENTREEIEEFANICGEYGIEFVDTSGAFVDFYETEHKFPNGFVNTMAGTGHFNKYGHEIIANELYERLKVLMEDKDGI